LTSKIESKHNREQIFGALGALAAPGTGLAGTTDGRDQGNARACVDSNRVPVLVKENMWPRENLKMPMH